MAKIHERVLEIVFTAANGAQTVQVTALNYYRDRGFVAAATPFALTFTPTTAQAVALPPEITVGELIPPPTHIRLKATVTA